MYEIQSKSDFAKKDFEFHMTIIKGAKNIFLTKAMHNNQEMFLHYMTEIIRLTKNPLPGCGRQQILVVSECRVDETL